MITSLETHYTTTACYTPSAFLCLKRGDGFARRQVVFTSLSQVR